MTDVGFDLYFLHSHQLNFGSWVALFSAVLRVVTQPFPPHVA